MTDPAVPRPLEIINPDFPRGPFRCAVFDFDGTLSLLRGDWQGLMVPMMVEALTALGTGEPREALTTLVEEFVTRLTGQPTMLQMEALGEEIVKRGQPRPDARVHLACYLDQLLSRTAERIAAVKSRRRAADEFLIRGSRPLLERLAAGGWLLAIASGTELVHLEREARVLQLERFFGPRVFGPVENDRTFSKEAVLRQLAGEHRLRGSEIAVIGDGPAEIAAAKAVGALALGVASDEVHGDGRINRLKREHLLRAGADLVVADYHDLPTMLQLLTPDP